MNPDTQFIKFCMNNYDRISSVYVFDEEREYFIRGVEISLKKGEFLFFNSEFTALHIDPFKSADGYSYIAIAYPENFKRWVTMMYEGKISTLVCKKFNYFNTLPYPEQKDIDDYKVIATAQIKEKFPHAYNIITNTKNA